MLRIIFLHFRDRFAKTTVIDTLEKISIYLYKTNLFDKHFIHIIIFKISAFYKLYNFISEKNYKMLFIKNTKIHLKRKCDFCVLLSKFFCKVIF